MSYVFKTSNTIIFYTFTTIPHRKKCFMENLHFVSSFDSYKSYPRFQGDLFMYISVNVEHPETLERVQCLFLENRVNQFIEA